MFQSTKLFDGFSTVFRQWKADSHCKYLHGYAVSFKVTFEGALDGKNWVWDFGAMKVAKTEIDGFLPQVWMNHMFDHTTIVSQDDPELEWFLEAEKRGIVDLRIVPHTGAERFAELVFNKLNEFVGTESAGRVRVVQVEFMENGKNTAIYGSNN
jgi:6-pyruvoyltetrahydropterin/6-carboxytetrahydropterin synthase